MSRVSQPMRKRPPAPARRSSGEVLSRIGMGLVLIAATVAVYWPALRGGLIMDDPEHITVPGLQSWAGLWRIWTVVGVTHQYFPVLHSAFWIEHRLWGDSVLGYHLTNVLLHAGSACLVVAIMRRLSLPGAWLGGFIFAVHPICVESVAWIAEQKNTLSTFFALASVLVYLGFDGTRRWWRFAIALALFVLAVLSKGVAITLPGGSFVETGAIAVEAGCAPAGAVGVDRGSAVPAGGGDGAEDDRPFAGAVRA
jgi:hypothetical protein